MTPDLPIPEAAREAAVEAFRTHWDDSLLVETCACEQQFGTTPELEAHIVDAIVEAALPHFRSLQVETQPVAQQVRQERAIRRQIAEEIAQACAERARLANRIPESTRSGVREGMIVAWIAAEKLAREIGSRETP